MIARRSVFAGAVAVGAAALVVVLLQQRPVPAEQPGQAQAAAARYQFMSAGGDLLFCGHHFREHEARLRPLALDVVDETARINEATPASVED